MIYLNMVNNGMQEKALTQKLNIHGFLKFYSSYITV